MAFLNALLHYDTLRHHIYYDYYFLPKTVQIKSVFMLFTD